MLHLSAASHEGIYYYCNSYYTCNRCNTCTPIYPIMREGGKAMTAELDRYGSIRPELDAIAAGTHFWCETHLCALPVADRSADPRYCQDCYDVLCQESAVLAERGQWKRPAWIPNPLPENIRAMLQRTRDTRNAVTKPCTVQGGIHALAGAKKGIVQRQKGIRRRNQRRGARR